MWTILLSLAAIVLVGVFVFLVVFFLLAPNNIFFTFIDEGTAKIVVRAGQFKKALIQWEGKTFDYEETGEDKWEVIDGEEYHFLGGLRYYGFWPLDDIFKYRLRWHDIQKVENGENPKFHDKVIDYVLLKPDIYWSKRLGLETLERIPADVDFLIKMRVVNPYKVIFRAPISFVENTISSLGQTFKGLVSNHTFDELLKFKGAGEECWEALCKDTNFKDFCETTIKGEWGLEIPENGIWLYDVRLDEKRQGYADKAWKAEREAERRTQETMGAVLSMIARAYGKSLEEIQGEISSNPKLQREFLKRAEDFVARQMAIDGGSFADIRVQGAEGLEKTLLNLFAAWQRMPQGSGNKETTDASQGKGYGSTKQNPKEKKEEVREKLRDYKKRRGMK